MTSALVGRWPVPLAVDDLAVVVVRPVDGVAGVVLAEAEAVPDDAGSEAEDAADSGAGTVLEEARLECGVGVAEFGDAGLLGARALPDAAAEFVVAEDGLAGGAELQPVTAMSAAVPAHRVRAAHRFSDRREGMPGLTLGWPNAATTRPS
jgi:hypothetical protein